MYTMAGSSDAHVQVVEVVATHMLTMALNNSKEQSELLHNNQLAHAWCNIGDTNEACPHRIDGCLILYECVRGHFGMFGRSISTPYMNLNCTCLSSLLQLQRIV
jgi:hypothetical protein